jgi:hypothetical protein
LKILAIEQELPGVTGEQYLPHLKSEAAKVWELLQAGVLREIYFDQNKRSAVMMLECTDAEQANQVLKTLPLVKENLIAFDIIPLVPYDGFARLYAKDR